MNELTPAVTSVPRRIPVVGVIGGIGSGKSSVARAVAAQANVHVIDADRLGHEALLDPNVKIALRRQFGDSIFDAAGEVQRNALARCVFGDSESNRAARHSLEQIVHPEIARQIANEIAGAEVRGQEAVLLDAAVLIEAGWRKLCDAVVFIDATEELRLERVRLRSGWTLEELHRREASQLNLPEKRRQSDASITNATDVTESGRQFLIFLRGRWSIGCKPPAESSQQLSSGSKSLPPC